MTYFTVVSVFLTTASNDRMIDEYSIWKYMQGSGRGSTEVQRTTKILGQDMRCSGPRFDPRTGILPNASLERYLQTNLLNNRLPTS
jgi:hypothetical protein